MSGLIRTMRAISDEEYKKLKAAWELWDYYDEFCRVHGTDGITDLVVKFEAAKKEIEQLRALCWAAYIEFNTVRARDGVPRTFEGYRSSVSDRYWSRLTDLLAAVSTSDPWPKEEWKPHLAALEDRDHE